MNLGSATSPESFRPIPLTTKPASILLVDDDEKNLLVLETILQSSEYELVKASTANAALMALIKGEFAAIVLDVQMPDLSGIELAKLIKKRRKTQHIPILFLTAYYQEDEQIVLGYGAGAVDFITKPVNPAVLRSKVGVFIDLFHKTTALAEVNRAMEAEIIERQQAEERFRMVVETAPNAMIVVAANGKITLVNSRTESLFGYTRGELFGEPVSMLIADGFGLSGAPASGTPAEASSPQGRERTGKRKDGSHVPMEVALSRFQSVDGDFELASFVDITERKEAEAALRAANAELEAKNAELQRQEKDRIRRIRAEAAKEEAEAAHERSALLAEASSILAGSFGSKLTLSALAQLAIQRLAACCLVDLIDEDGQLHLHEIAFRESRPENGLEELGSRAARAPARLAAINRVLSTGQPELWAGLSPEEWAQVEAPAQDQAWLQEHGFRSFVIAPLSARGRVLGTLSLSNFAQHPFSRSEVALVEELAARAALALDNARLYHDAAQAREAAEAANSAKDRFLAMLSHELRTPLSPVLHAVALLEEEDTCSIEVKETLETIRRNVQLEARLIDDLLDLARIRNGKLQLHAEPVDAHDLLRRAVEICQPEIAAGQLHLTLNLNALHPQLHADPARIQQIFWNLITNAIKYTPREGSIQITTADDPSAGTLRVQVTDSGIGLGDEQIGKIFDAFEQVHGDRSSGLGLGLAICRAVATLHGGRIEVKSAGVGHGTTFTVTLPVGGKEPTPPLNPPVPEVQNPSTPLRLLLVEDHADTAAMLTRLLIRRGYLVQSANSVAGAHRLLESAHFDVLVSDIGLPDGSGPEIIPRFVEHAGTRPIGSIALSGYGMPEDIERSKAAGFSEHLTKPVDIALLTQILGRLGDEIQARS